MASESAQNIAVTHFSIEWRIPDFFPLEEKCDSFLSPDFKYLGVNWNIKLYKAQGFYEMYIRKINTDRSHRYAYYSIGIKKTDGTVYKSAGGKKLVGDLDDLGKTKEFLRPCDLLRDKMDIAPQNILVVFCNLSLEANYPERLFTHASIQTEKSDRRDASTEIEQEDLERAENEDFNGKLALPNQEENYKLAEDLRSLLLSGTHFDTTIKIHDREYRVHRAILGARSPVFESMFCHDTTERNTGTVEIEDCDPDAFQDFLLYLYSGKVETLSSENVLPLYALADKYDVEDVKIQYINFMARNFCVNNFCDFVVVAVRHNELELLKSATDYFIKNTKEIIISAKWQCFHQQYPVESNELYIKAIEYRDQ